MVIIVTNSNNTNASKADSIVEEDRNEHKIQVAATNESVGNADLGIEQVKDNNIMLKKKLITYCHLHLKMNIPLRKS